MPGADADLRSEVAEAADFSAIRYSQSWEDPRCLEHAFGSVEGACVLSIAAAGDNSFALLAMGASRVVSVDLNPAQCALVELKAAAIAHLDHADLVRFVGARPATDRRATYDRLREYLPADARAFWDAHPELIEAGVIHVGRLEGMWRVFRTRALPLLLGRRRVLDGFTPRDAAGRRRYWRDTFYNRRMRLVLRLFFSRRMIARLGRDPAFFEHVRIEPGRHYVARARHAFVALEPARNPFLQYILLGRYLSIDEHCHPWLDPARHELIRSRLGRLEVHCGELEQFLAGCPDDTFDACNLSDIFEWMSEPLYERMLRALVRVTRPGGRLAYWNNLVERSRPDLLADRLEPLPALAAEAHHADRAFVYRGFQIEQVSG